MKLPLVENIQVNIPFRMLESSYLDHFLRGRINPEIGFDAAVLDTNDPSSYARMAEPLRDAGLSITVHGPFMDLAPGSPDPEIRRVTRDRFERFLKAIRVFRPKTVVCHAGYDKRRYWPLWDLWLEKSVEFWGRLSERVRDEGSLLVLENVYEDEPRDLLALFRPLEDRGVGFCLDTGHQAAFSPAGLERWLTCLAPYLVQIHLHDNRGAQDEHLALGRGTIDFSTFFRDLVRLKRDPPVITLEPHREEDLEPSLEYLDRIWPWKRQRA